MLEPKRQCVCLAGDIASTCSEQSIHWDLSARSLGAGHGVLCRKGLWGSEPPSHLPLMSQRPVQVNTAQALGGWAQASLIGSQVFEGTRASGVPRPKAGTGATRLTTLKDLSDGPPGGPSLALRPVSWSRAGQRMSGRAPSALLICVCYHAWCRDPKNAKKAQLSPNK